MVGGLNPGAGRPKGARDGVKRTRRKKVVPPKAVEVAPPVVLPEGWSEPLEYMLAIVNDPAIEAFRRDRMAIAAAPYRHAKLIEDKRVSKKEVKAEAAEEAQKGGSEWGDDLRFEGRAEVERPN